MIIINKDFYHKIPYKNIISLCKKYNIKPRRNKQDMINEIINIKKYKIIEKIGEGNDSKTYKVLQYSNPISDYLAMKVFRKNKSINKILKEAMFQNSLSKFNITPIVYEVNLIHKYIIMEKLDQHLIHKIIENKGKMTNKHQKELINIYKTLDNNGIFHYDANIMNYMLKDGVRLVMVKY